jgi:hypothetical protein
VPLDGAPKDNSVLPARITLHSEEWLTVHLREGRVARRVSWRIVLAVNDVGRWIRGIELTGGVGFDLKRALEPLHPRKGPPGESGGVIYGEEADRAFIYFSMRPPEASLAETSLRYCRSIDLEADLAFDSGGGLVWLRFSPGDANKSSADFVSLINAPLERFVSR